MRREPIGPLAARWARSIVVIAILGFAAILLIYPFVFIFQASFAPTGRELFRLPPPLFPADPTIDNFFTAFERIPMVQLFFNSVIITSAITVGMLAVSTLAAYAFARMEFRFKRILFIILILSLLIPIQATIVPLFILMRQIGLYDSYFAVILPGLVSAFGVFFLRQHFMTIPNDYEDAASIDGASRMRILRSIFVPLSRPTLAALGIITFAVWWNEVLVPLVMISRLEGSTVPVGLVVLAGRFSSTFLGVMAAAIAAMVLPVLIVFVIAQRQIIKGVISGGIKA